MFINRKTLEDLRSELKVSRFREKAVNDMLDAHLEEHKKPILAKDIEIMYEVAEHNLQTDIIKGTAWACQNDCVTIYDNRDIIATMWNCISVRFVKGETEERS